MGKKRLSPLSVALVLAAILFLYRPRRQRNKENNPGI